MIQLSFALPPEIGLLDRVVEAIKRCTQHLDNSPQESAVYFRTWFEDYG